MPRPTILIGEWKALATRLGGIGKLAEAMGVRTSTIRRWASGEMEMSGPAKKLLAILMRDAHV